MTRALAVVALIAALATGAGLSRARLERITPDRVPAELLYLPEGPYLRALALGHEETLADLLYIWAIQYYSNFDDAKLRFQYLEKVFGGAITELDPRFEEVYVVGALIMSAEAREPDMALRLYDKGLELNPNAWELAYWAGWECYLAKRYACAKDYWSRARDMPDAPAQLLRLAAASLARAGDLESALAQYRALYENPPDERTRVVAERWVRRLEAEAAMAALDRAIGAYRERHGRCPGSLDVLAREGLLSTLPHSREGEPYRYDPETCRVLPPQGHSMGESAP